MNLAGDTEWIAQRAEALGFSLCGVARLERFPEHAAIEEWLRRGYGGGVEKLSFPQRRAPAQGVWGAQSGIVCGLEYNTGHRYLNETAACGGRREAPGGSSSPP